MEAELVNKMRRCNVPAEQIRVGDQLILDTKRAGTYGPYELVAVTAVTDGDDGIVIVTTKAYTLLFYEGHPAHVIRTATEAELKLTGKARPAWMTS